MGRRAFASLHWPLDNGLPGGIGCVTMDDVATFIRANAKNDEVARVRMNLYNEILAADRTGKSLMAQGFSRSDLQYSMQILVKEGLVFKYGVGINTYYSVTKDESKERSKKIDPIIIPKQYVDNLKLAMRMGYTNIEPKPNRTIRRMSNDKES